MLGSRFPSGHNLRITIPQIIHIVFFSITCQSSNIFTVLILQVQILLITGGTGHIFRHQRLLKRVYLSGRNFLRELKLTVFLFRIFIHHRIEVLGGKHSRTSINQGEFQQVFLVEIGIHIEFILMSYNQTNRVGSATSFVNGERHIIVRLHLYGKILFLLQRHGIIGTGELPYAKITSH